MYAAISILPLAIGTILAPLTSSPQKEPQAATRPWPVHIVDCERHPGGRSPAMVVGSLFSGGHCYREDQGNRVHQTPLDQIVRPSPCAGNKYSKAMNEYLLGNVRPRPSCDEEETCVFLTSPPLNNGFEFTIDGVELTANTWTVHASYWYDDIKHQWGPGANHEAQMLRLGWLKPGNYTCKLELSHRFMKAGTTRPGVYANTKVEVGEVAFSIAKSDPWQFHPWDQEPSKAVLRFEDLKPAKFEAGPDQQMPFYAVRRVEAGVFRPAPGESAKPADRVPTTTLVVTPPLEWTNWAQKSATLWEHPAAEPAGGVLVAQITGGKDQQMGRYDWAEVTSIDWHPGIDPGITPGTPPSVTINARVWRRALIDGSKPEITLPAFAIPLIHQGLGAPAELAKKLKVTVLWSEAIDDPRSAG